VLLTGTGRLGLIEVKDLPSMSAFPVLYRLGRCPERGKQDQKDKEGPHQEWEITGGWMLQISFTGHSK
jgi:hypothetical protein